MNERVNISTEPTVGIGPFGSSTGVSSDGQPMEKGRKTATRRKYQHNVRTSITGGHAVVLLPK